MDNVASLECLKLDSQSEELDKDGGGKDHFSPEMVPLNCDPSIIGECGYCLNVDDHPTQLCSYRYKVPEGAIVGECCVVACLVCGCFFRDSRCPGCDTSLGRAILKNCLSCGTYGEHFSFDCPKSNRDGFTCDPYTGSFSVEIFPVKG